MHRLWAVGRQTHGSGTGDIINKQEVMINNKLCVLGSSIPLCHAMAGPVISFHMCVANMPNTKDQKIKKLMVSSVSLLIF